jgi:hypothetical protein
VELPVSSDRSVIPRERELQYVVDRVMHVWSLIELIPERRLTATRSSITAFILENAHLTDRELIKAALQHLQLFPRLRSPRQT